MKTTTANVSRSPCLRSNSPVAASARYRRWPTTGFLLVAFLTFVSTASAQSVISVTSLGARSDGTQSSVTTEAFQKAFATNPTGEIVVPSGIYLLDNSAGPLTVKNFSGHLTFQGSAQLVFADNAKGGLLFIGGSGAIISGLRATYATFPTVRRSPNEQLKFSNTTNTILIDTIVEHSPAAGIIFYNSINPTVTNATVLNSLADGLNFSNCQNARVTNLLTENTGDDGLAFVNYSEYPNLVGGLAQGIVVTNSKARGIAIAGQSNVTVNGFQIQNTSSSGVLVAQDVPHNTRVPANVFIENGTIWNAGKLTPLVGNQYGIEFNSQKSATFTNIAVFDPENNGLSGTAPSGSVVVNNVSIHGPRLGLGFLFYKTQDVQLMNSASSNTPSYGFLSLESRHVIVQGLTVTNAGVSNPLKRAVWFEDAKTIFGSSINVVSTEKAATTIGCYLRPPGLETSGSVRIINLQVDEINRPVLVENSCPGVTFVP
jgi:polygalacturonase